MIVSFKQPILKEWRLFGSSSLARLLDKPKVSSQCEICWDFHYWKNCSRPQRCGQCGQKGHSSVECTSPQQCPNCLEPAPANHLLCPLQPKIVSGAIQRPNQQQRKAIRIIGAKKFRRVNPEYLAERNNNNASSSLATLSSLPTPTPLTTLNLASMGMDVDMDTNTEALPLASPTPSNATIIPRTQGIKRCINQVSTTSESETNEL